MQTIKNKMTKWLHAFAILFQIGAILLGISAGACAILEISILFKKDILGMKLDDTTTLKDAFGDFITSRWDLFTIIGLTLIYLAIMFVVLVLLYKWFKKAYTTGDPISISSIEFMRKSAKFIYIACLIGFIFENLVLVSVNNSDLYAGSDYMSLLFIGLFVHLLSHIFAYANATRKEEFIDITSENKENSQNNNEISQ